MQVVKINLLNDEAVRSAWRAVACVIEQHGLTGAFTGCLVQEQMPEGVELLLSIRNDPQFGPLILAGAGGTMVELLHDVASAPAPVSREAAEQLIRGLRVSRLLQNWRGGGTRDLSAAIDAAVRLSWLAVDLGEQLIDLEINPLIVGAVGAGVRAVDIRAEWIR